MRYILYVRKSSEPEDRQMSSIEDQTAEMKRVAAELNLQIVDTVCESMSAKRPGRPSFNSMLTRIQRGEADGILCWKLNRLARNPVDGGQISWMLQQRTIKHIQTYGRAYTPDDNVLMMQVEFGIANQFIKDLKGDVERGMKRKAERGWYPTKPPVGYKAVGNKIRQPHEDEIITDPVQFSLVRQLWDLVLTKRYSVTDIKKEGDRMGLRKRNGTTYSLNTYYGIFSNIFYTGRFIWTPFNGIQTTYEGKHQPMVTSEEFQKVQDILHQRGDIRNRKHLLPYRGLIRCGECQGGVTAEHKLQAICTGCKYKFSIITAWECPRCKTKLSSMKKPSIIDIVYYRCTKKNHTCTQKYITKSALEETIIHEVKRLSIPKGFRAWALPVLLNKDEKKVENKEFKQLKKRKTELQHRLDGFVVLRADGDISKEQFESYKTAAIEELDTLTHRLERINNTESRTSSELLEKVDFLQTAMKIFKKGDESMKTKLLGTIGSNLTLKDKKLVFTTDIVLRRLKEAAIHYRSKIWPFEPEITYIKQGQNREFDHSIQVLCSKLRAIRTLQKRIIQKRQKMKLKR